MTTKTQPQIAHAGDVMLDATGRPLYQIPNEPEVTGAIRNFHFSQTPDGAGFAKWQPIKRTTRRKTRHGPSPMPSGSSMGCPPRVAFEVAGGEVRAIPGTYAKDAGANLQQEAFQRSQLMQQQGRDLNDPAVQNYVATGQFRQEGNLPATVMRAISCSDDDLSNLYHAQDALSSLQAINNDTRRAGAWSAMSNRRSATRQLHGAAECGRRAMNSTDFDKVLTEQMLLRLKRYFGGRPAFAADQQTLKVTPTTAMSPTERAPLQNNMATRVDQLITHEEARNANLRAGTYFKPGGSGVQAAQYGQNQAPPQAQPPQLPRSMRENPFSADPRVQVQSAADYAALPSGTPYTDPDGTPWVKQ